MIADFLIDYSYVADRLSQCESEFSPFYIGLKMLCDYSDYDNVRFIVDQKGECLATLQDFVRKLDMGNDLQRKKKRLALKFIPTPSNKHRFRFVPSINVAPSRNLEPFPFCVISAQGGASIQWRVEDSYCPHHSIESYFIDWDLEKKRLKWTKRYTFGLSFTSFNELPNIIKRFRGSDTEFRIYDRYAMMPIERLEDKCKKLLKWLEFLSDEWRDACTFVVQASTPWYNDGREIDLVQLCTKIKDILTNQMNQLYGRGNRFPQTVIIRFVRDDSTSIRHDRFICSQTRVFSIGKGIDAIGAKCLNLQYCGIYKKDPLMVQLEKLRIDETLEVCL